MSEVTDEYLDRLQAICDAATEGPWESDTFHGDGIDPSGHGVFVANSDPQPGNDNDYHHIAVCYLRRPPSDNVSNSKFIAESRTALPLLIAEVRRLRAQLAKAGKNGIAAGILIGTVAKDLRTGADLLEE